MFKIQSDTMTWGGCITGLREWPRTLVFLHRMATQGEDDGRWPFIEELVEKLEMMHDNIKYQISHIRYQI